MENGMKRFLLIMATASVAVHGHAATYVLKSSKAGWDVRTEGSYSSSQECEKVRKQKQKDDPDRSYVCLNA
jgi:hypothetical protein